MNSYNKQNCKNEMTVFRVNKYIKGGLSIYIYKYVDRNKEGGKKRKRIGLKIFDIQVSFTLNLNPELTGLTEIIVKTSVNFSWP